MFPYFFDEFCVQAKAIIQHVQDSIGGYRIVVSVNYKKVIIGGWLIRDDKSMEFI
jgi:hypothetical protein